MNDDRYVTAAERSLYGTLLLGMSTPQPAGATSPVHTLSWDLRPLGMEGTLPAAVVTWRSHRAAADAGTAAAPEDPLAALPLGASLVDALTRVGVTEADDYLLLDVAARWHDVVSWATAMQSRALGEIARRRAWTAEHNAAAAEISARLRVPQGEANKLMARGAGLAEHPQVMDALHRARIDTTKADILLRSGNPLTDAERDQAITQYLPQAPDHTRTWLRGKMNTFAAHLKGTAETARHAKTRRAVFLDPADNAMAWISAHLSAIDAAAVWDAIDATAHILRRTPGATRTLAQARADALVAIATGRVIVPPHPECAPAHDIGAPGAKTGIAGASTAGTSTGSGGTAVDGASPEVAQLPRTTVPAAGCTCGGCTCGGTRVRILPVRPQIRITVPATTLLGTDSMPGHLDGYGPVPADVVALLATDATWQRLVTDPVTGILTDYSTTSYRPGKVLRAAVTARDQACCFPQCDRPARWADLDHIQPFDHAPDPRSRPYGAPGQTRAQNLQPLCRAHHLAKTHHGWDVKRDPDTGVTTWIAPTGHRYARPPAQTGPVTARTSSGLVSNDITSLREDARHRLGWRATPRRTSRRAGDLGTDRPALPDEPPF